MKLGNPETESLEGRLRQNQTSEKEERSICATVYRLQLDYLNQNIWRRGAWNFDMPGLGMGYLALDLENYSDQLKLELTWLLA
jgi:hypothetical protein